MSYVPALITCSSLNNHQEVQSRTGKRMRPGGLGTPVTQLPHASRQSTRTTLVKVWQYSSSATIIQMQIAVRLALDFTQLAKIHRALCVKKRVKAIKHALKLVNTIPSMQLRTVVGVSYRAGIRTAMRMRIAVTTQTPCSGSQNTIGENSCLCAGSCTLSTLDPVPPNSCNNDACECSELTFCSDDYTVCDDGSPI